MNFLSKTRAMVIGICFTVLGLGVLVYGTILLVNLRKPAVDLNKTDWTTLKPYQHVCVDLDFLMDEYMIHSSGRSESSMKETARYFTVPELVMDEDGSLYMKHFMGVVVPSKEVETYKRIADNSYEWWTDETGTVAWGSESVYIDGYLGKMSKDGKKYMREYLQEIGYTDAEIDEMMIPYVIMNNASSVSALVIAGAVLTVLGAGFIIWTVIRIKKDKELMNATVNHSSFSNYYGGNNFR